MNKAYMPINTHYHDELRLAGTEAGELYIATTSDPDESVAQSIVLETAIRHIQIDTINAVIRRMESGSSCQKLTIRSLNQWSMELATTPIDTGAPE